MAAIISFFIIVTSSFIILRIATEVLRLTGLSIDIARFQALSAFTGTGFSTRESELIVNHPVRRRVIMTLMLVRNVGFITVISSLVISFIDIASTEDFLLKAAYLGGGSLLLFLLSRLKLVNNLLSWLVERALKKWTKIHIHDYDSLLNLSSEFEVITCLAGEESWLANQCLQDLKLSDEGILILGITRQDGYYIGTPQGSTVIFPADRLIMYGREDFLRRIGARKAGAEGDLEHEEAVKQQLILEGRKPEITVKKPGFLGRIFKRFRQ